MKEAAKLHFHIKVNGAPKPSHITNNGDNSLPLTPWRLNQKFLPRTPSSRRKREESSVQEEENTPSKKCRRRIMEEDKKEDNVKVREEVQTGRMEEDLREAEPSSLSSFGNQGGQENDHTMIKVNSSQEKELLVAHNLSQVGEYTGRPF